VQVVQKFKKPPPSAAMKAMLMQQMVMYAGLAMGAGTNIMSTQGWQTSPLGQPQMYGAGAYNAAPGSMPHQGTPGFGSLNGRRKGRSDVWLRGQS
jgi:hypothetical protein